MLRPLIPQGEALRHAFQWIAEQGHCTLTTVEQASLRFDLTPCDEEFLLQQFVHHHGAASDAVAGSDSPFPATLLTQTGGGNAQFY